MSKTRHDNLMNSVEILKLEEEINKIKSDNKILQSSLLELTKRLVKLESYIIDRDDLR